MCIINEVSRTTERLAWSFLFLFCSQQSVAYLGKPSRDCLSSGSAEEPPFRKHWVVEVTVILPQTLAQGVHGHYVCAQAISVLFMLVGLGWAFRSIHQLGILSVFSSYWALHL